jgi:hypothetical protein
MERADVSPHIRHWVEVYVGTNDDPAYRGTLLWHPGDTETSIVVNGARDEDFLETTVPVRIADIRKIVPLGDPPWLVESNRSAAIISAQGIVYRAQGPDESDSG